CAARQRLQQLRCSLFLLQTCKSDENDFYEGKRLPTEARAKSACKKTTTFAVRAALQTANGAVRNAYRVCSDTSAISSRMRLAAAGGCGSPVIGRPTTMWLTPARRASEGVTMRAWSPTSDPAGRI